MGLKSILLGAGLAAFAAGAASAAQSQTTILQLGASKAARVSSTAGMTVKTAHGVKVYRATPQSEPATAEAKPTVVKKIIEKKLIIEERYYSPIKHLRTQGFYSGHPGRSRRFTQGFYSGPADLGEEKLVIRF